MDLSVTIGVQQLQVVERVQPPRSSAISCGGLREEQAHLGGRLNRFMLWARSVPMSRNS
jgi:hypothetical protein